MPTHNGVWTYKNMGCSRRGQYQGARIRVTFSTLPVSDSDFFVSMSGSLTKEQAFKKVPVINAEEPKKRSCQGPKASMMRRCYRISPMDGHTECYLTHRQTDF
jgi:hypothetical protein